MDTPDALDVLSLPSLPTHSFFHATQDKEGGDRGNINLSARLHTQSIERIGGGLGSKGERQRRSWLVLGIGVGAVGSFLAAVAFAVRQYREVSGVFAVNNGGRGLGFGELSQVIDVPLRN